MLYKNIELDERPDTYLELKKITEFNEMYNRLALKLKINNYYDFNKINYNNKIGYFCLLKKENGEEVMAPGFPTNDKEKALQFYLARNLLSKASMYEATNRTMFQTRWKDYFDCKLDYDSRVVVFEDILRKINEVFNGHVKDEVVDYYLGYLNNDDNRWNYNKSLSEFVYLGKSNLIRQRTYN